VAIARGEAEGAAPPDRVDEADGTAVASAVGSVWPPAEHAASASTPATTVTAATNLSTGRMTVAYSAQAATVSLVQ
jgi:hypothetical protein